MRCILIIDVLNSLKFKQFVSELVDNYNYSHMNYIEILEGVINLRSILYTILSKNSLNKRKGDNI